jgi:hypothetical protein
MIARVALVLCRFAVDVHPSDGATMKTSQIAFGGQLLQIQTSISRITPWT